MTVLALNAGSTSLKFGLFDDAPEALLTGQIDWSGGDRRRAALTLRRGPAPPELSSVAAEDDAAAAACAIGAATRAVAATGAEAIGAIGHRVVHGGAEFSESRLVDHKVKAAIARWGALAPLHNPPALRVIEATEAALPGVPQVAVFDTAFFARLPLAATLYPVPFAWYEQWGIRRFGFHGISHAYCAGRAAEFLGREPAGLRLVICHLGGGCSAAAIRAGNPAASTLGFSPLDGLMNPYPRSQAVTASRPRAAGGPFPGWRRSAEASLRWFGRVAGPAALLALGVLAGRAQDTLPELHTAAEVRGLSPAQAERHYPVRLRGVITFFNEGLYSRFIQDSTAGIYLLPWTNQTDFVSGQLAEVVGKTGAGDYAPVIQPDQVTAVGEGALPEARRVSFDELASGRQDSQFVELSGIVRSTRRDETANCLALEIATGGGRLTAYAPAASDNGNDLVDSTVRLRGVCSSEFNHLRQLLRIRVLIPRAADLVVETPAPADPFAIPTQSLGSLLQFTLQGNYGHRVKVAGVLVYHQPGRMVVIQDQKQGLMVQSAELTPLRVGDRIEAVGFPAAGDYTPTLQDAICRVSGAAGEPNPARISVDEALQGLYDCRLVRLEGRVLDRALQRSESSLILQSGALVFHADREAGDQPDPFERVENGSQVAVTGVCLIEPGSGWYAGGEWRAKSFRLLLRSPADVRVLRSPPWWSLRRLLWMVAILGLVVLTAFAWVGVLRRRVRDQTEIIRQKLEAEAALKERYLSLFEHANDMVYTHDLAGRLTSINLAGEDLLQFRREAILGRDFVELVVPEQRDAARQWLEQAVKGLAAATVEWDFAAAFGQRVKLEISTRLIESGGRPVEVEGVARDITERRRLEQELLEISGREQRRIGHDLHDGVCQQLAGISFLTENLAESLEEKGAAESGEAHRIGQLLKTAITQTRGVARGLSPVRLEENGLASALEELAGATTGLFHIPCHFTAEPAMDGIDHAMALHLYFIAREAVANAAKHSHPSRIDIALTPAGDRAALSIRDDGSGFSPPLGRQAGMGLRIMQYRARVIGATLEIKSQPAGGTEVRCLFSAPAQG